MATEGEWERGLARGTLPPTTHTEGLCLMRICCGTELCERTRVRMRDTPRGGETEGMPDSEEKNGM